MDPRPKIVLTNYRKVQKTLTIAKYLKRDIKNIIAYFILSIRYGFYMELDNDINMAVDDEKTFALMMLLLALSRLQKRMPLWKNFKGIIWHLLARPTFLKLKGTTIAIAATAAITPNRYRLEMGYFVSGSLDIASANGESESSSRWLPL